MASILTILGTFPPEAFDAIIPHGHRRSGGRVSVTNRIDYVALNPQPLPPREGFLVASAELAHEIGRLAVETDLVRGGGSDLVRELVDDWCGTGWPRRWPFPWPGPVPGTRTHDLDPADGQPGGGGRAGLAGRPKGRHRPGGRRRRGRPEAGPGGAAS